MKFSIAGLVLAASAATAFESTVPCIMWSPKDFIQPVVKQQLVLKASDAMKNIESSFSPNFCDAKFIAVVDQPSLHATDFSRPEYRDTFATIKAHCRQAASLTQIEYISDQFDVEKLTTAIARQCDGAISILDANSVSDSDLPLSDLTTVLTMKLPPLEHGSAEEIGTSLDRLVQALQDKAGGDYVVIFTSSVPKMSSGMLRKRSLIDMVRRAPTSEDNRPIFEKYQLFSPAILMGLAVSLIFVFVVATGVTWLSGIQTPLRFDNKPKKA